MSNLYSALRGWLVVCTAYSVHFIILATFLLTPVINLCMNLVSIKITLPYASNKVLVGRNSLFDGKIIA